MSDVPDRHRPLREPVDAPGRLAAVRATGLLPVGGDPASAPDPAPDEALDRLTGMARTLLRAPYAFLTVVDDGHSWFRSRSGTGDGGPHSLPVTDSLCRYVVTEAAPLVLGDVRGDARMQRNPTVTEHGLVAWAGFPVFTPDGHVLGALAVTDIVPRRWTDAERANLSALAAVASREVALRAALAAADAALRAATAATAAAREAAGEAERAHARAALFARVGELLTAGLDLPAVWRALVRLTVPALADYAFVHSVTREVLTGQSLLHRDPAAQQQAEELTHAVSRRITDRSGPGLVARTGDPQLVHRIDDVTDALTPEQRAAVDQLDAVSSISLPLRARGELIGVLTVVRVRGSALYTEDDVALLGAIAARAALALDNTLAYHRERRSSLRLQTALLTEQLPRTAPLELASGYLPAGRRQLVGGDWYDAFVDGAGATTLVIGDVAGHDIAAAAVMGQLRAMIRMAGHDGLMSPAQVFCAVDAATDGLSTSVFATAQLVQVTPAGPGDPPGSSVLRWSSAGHLPPVVVGPSGRAVLLDRRPDRPLGLGLTPALSGPRHDHRDVLLPGTTLVLYTDGLVEGREHDLDVGTERLLDAATALRGVPADQACRMLLAALSTQGADDIAVLVLRNPGAGRPAAAAGAASARMPA